MPALGLGARLRRVVARAARRLGVRLLEATGPLPTACLVIRIADGSKRGRAVRLLNVKHVERADGFLVVTDLYGRVSHFALSTLLSARATETVPCLDIVRGAVAVA